MDEAQLARFRDLLEKLRKLLEELENNKPEEPEQPEEPNEPEEPQEPEEPNPSTNRIAYSCDGNFHDRDDIGASAMGLALIYAAGRKNDLVHYDYNSHFPDTDDSMEREMTESVMTPANTLGFPDVFFDSQRAREGAIANLVREINESSNNNRLKLVVAGPFEIVWQAFNRSDRSKHGFVDIVSHSNWNNTHQHNNTHTLNDVKRDFPSVTVIQIADQNARLNTGSNWGPWNWLSGNQQLEWLMSRMRAVGRADVSDAGMIYYVLYGNKQPTPVDFRVKITSANPSPEPEPEPEPKPEPEPEPEPPSNLRVAKGCFVLQPGEEAVKQPNSGRRVSTAELKAAKGIVGLTIRVRPTWLHPGRNDWDFSVIDSCAKSAKDAGKKYKILLMAGPLPSFVGGEMVNGYPVPWNPEALAYWKDCMNRIANRYNSDSSFVEVHVPGLTGGGASEEKFHDKGWENRPGYSDRKVIDAHLDLITYMALQFPNVGIAYSIGGSAGRYMDDIIREASKVCRPKQFSVKHNALKSTTPTNWISNQILINATKSLPVRMAFEMVGSTLEAPRQGGEARTGSKNIDDSVNRAKEIARLGNFNPDDLWIDIYPPDMNEVNPL